MALFICVDTVGDLRRAITPYIGECEITPLVIEYIPSIGDRPAYLKIETTRKENMENVRSS